jgi:hypothetical protein
MFRRLLSAAFVVTLVAMPSARADVTDDVLDIVFGTQIGMLNISTTPVKGTIEVAKTLTGGVAVVKKPGGDGDYPTQWNCNLSNVLNITCTTGRAAPKGSWSCEPGGPWVYVTMSGTPGSFVNAASKCASGDPGAECRAAMPTVLARSSAAASAACTNTGSVVTLASFSCPITPHIAVLEWHVTCHTYDP